MFHDIVVSPGGRLSVGLVHSALVPADDEARAVVDLRNAEWVEPLGLVAVATFAEFEAGRGRRVVLRAPRLPGRAQYLSRMRLGSVLEQLDMEHDLPPVNEWDTAGRLLELSRFTGPEEPDQLGRMLFDRTESVWPMATTLHQSVAELGSNVLEHSGRAGYTFGYVAAQTTYRDTVVQFAVGDAGQGVAGGFVPARTLSDALALELTLQQGVSRTGMPGHGQGLRKVRQLVTALHGSLHMVSGTAHRTAYGRSSACGSATYGYQGTLLQGTFKIPPGEGGRRR